MQWLNPGAAWWLLLLPALLALYIFRPQPLRRRISSLRLWQGLPQMDRPRARIRRPPLSLLLLLQALLLAAGAMALLQPALLAPSGGHTVVILDASGSMMAADGSSTRFESAKREAARIVSALGPEDRATLLWAGIGVTNACSICTKGDFERALSGLEAGAGRADLGAALSVAAGLARRSSNGVVQTHVVSDGAFEPLSPEVMPPSVEFNAVGGAANNRAVTVLSARRPPDGSPGYTAYARVDNHGTGEARAEVAALADTVPLPTRSLTLPPGGHADLVWRLPAGTVRFTVNLQSPDALPADDRAVLFLPSEGQHKVHVISPQPQVYGRALAGIPGLEVVTGTLATGSDAAFTIIEGRLPDPLPAGSLLLVNPQGAILPAGGEMAEVRPSTGSDHPLLGGVDLLPLLVRKARLFEPTPWLETVAGADDGPLILAGEREGQRIAVLAFSPADSNLPKLAAFPLLMANLVDWLYPLAGVASLQPGEGVRLPAGSTVTVPSGGNLTVGASGLFGETGEPGLYRVSGEGRRELTFAVNMTDRAESDTRARPHPELNLQSPPASADEGQTTNSENANSGSLSSSALSLSSAPQSQFWWPLAALALALLGAEWLFYCMKRGRA